MEPWKRNLYSLWATEFLAALGMALVLPFLPFYIRELGVEELHDVERWSGLVFAAPFLVGIFTGPLWGWLGDRYGRRMMLIRAVFGFAIPSFFMGFVQTVEQLFILRLIQGGISGFIAATLAIVSTTTPRQHMGYAIGFLQTSLTTGAVIGPLFGGFLADQIGYRNIFFITGGLACVAGFLVIFFVREDERPPEEIRMAPSFLSNFRFVFSSQALVVIFLGSLIVQLAVMSIQPVLSLFVEMLWPNKENVSTIAGTVFAITGIASLLSAPYWGRRGDRRGYKKVLTIALIGTGVTCVPQAFVSRAYQLILLRFFHGLFAGGILPALYTLTSLNAPEERRGGVLSITRNGLLLGNALGPIAGGYLAAFFGLRPLFLSTAALLILLTFSARHFIQEPPH